MIDGGCMFRSERWHMHGHLIHQGRRIIFLFKHCTIVTAVVGAEPEGGGGGVAGSLHLRAQERCKTWRRFQLQPQQEENISGRGTRTGKAAVECVKASLCPFFEEWHGVCLHFFPENTDESEFLNALEVKGRATILWDTPWATELQSVYLGNTHSRLGLLATSAADKYSWRRRLRLPGIRVFVISRLARKYI